MQEVLSFWIDEVGEQGWYREDAEVDGAIRRRFGPIWEDMAQGQHRDWLCGAQGALAYLLVTDQFSRNMHRGSALSFATDAKARSAAKLAVLKGWDLRISGSLRQFFYLPMMHSEILSDQEHCMRMFLTRMPKSDSNLRHARAHRQVIRDFGRFPYRNDALGRASTDHEQAWMAAGGYRLALAAVDAT